MEILLIPSYLTELDPNTIRRPTEPVSLTGRGCAVDPESVDFIYASQPITIKTVSFIRTGYIP